MIRKRLILTVGGTALCALAAGYFMQMGGSAAPRTATAPLPAPIQQAIVAPVVEPAVTRNAMLDLTGIAAVSALPDLRPPAPMPAPRIDAPGTRREASAGGGAIPAAPADPEAPRLGCEVAVAATPAPQASVALKVSAPCHGNQRLSIHHSGMTFAETTDADGSLSVVVPVLSEKAVFIVAFASGKGGVATARVPDLADVDRIALQWNGRGGFELHALEYGAGYDDPGHAWIGAAPGAAAGSVVRLGDAGMPAAQLVEIYTFPAVPAPRPGTVTLSVETEVTADNCGRDISAQVLQRHRGAGLGTRDLVLSMPRCTALGDFLVLNNLIDDLKIAAR